MKTETSKSLLDLVGNTPLVELPRLTPKPGVQIYAKLEANATEERRKLLKLYGA